MKLPIYTPQVSPETQLPNPRPAQFENAPPSGAGQLGEALTGLGETIGALAIQRARAENLVEKSRQAVNLAKATTDLETFTADRVQQTDSSVSAAEADKAYRRDAGQFIQNYVQTIPDEQQRNIAAVHLMGKADIGASHVRGQANARIIQDTRIAALQQLQELARKGTPDALKEGMDLAQGLTDAGIFTGIEGADAIKILRHASIQSAFSLDVAAGASAAFDKVNRGDGIYGILDASEQAHLRTAAKEQIQKQANEEFTLWSHARTMAEAARLDQERADKRQESDFLSAFHLDLSEGKYGIGASVNETAIHGMLRGRPSPVVDHALALVDAYKKQERVADAQQSAQLAASFRTDIRDADEAGARSAIRRAELAVAAGTMRPTEMDSVQKVYEGRLQRLDLLRTKARDEKVQLMQSQEKQAIHEMLSWMPSKDDPLLLSMRGSLIQAEEGGRAIIDRAINSGEDPVAAIRAARPELVLRTYQDVTSAYTSRVSDLGKSGFRGPDDLRAARGRLPEGEYRRLMEMALEVESLKRWIANNPVKK